MSRMEKSSDIAKEYRLESEICCRCWRQCRRAKGSSPGLHPSLEEGMSLLLKLLGGDQHILSSRGIPKVRGLTLLKKYIALIV